MYKTENESVFVIIYETGKGPQCLGFMNAGAARARRSVALLGAVD